MPADEPKVTPLPATADVLPDEQDRKRFVGCLACVLANAYQYDDVDENEDFERAVREANRKAGLLEVTSSQAPPPARRSSSLRPREERLALCTARHRQRRYQVLSRLLLASADYLRLEQDQVKAFLPLLSPLLTPDEKLKPDTEQQETASDDADGEDIELVYKAPVHSFDSENLVSDQIDSMVHLRPFLEEMTPGAGYRCLALYVLQHLLQSGGYDARARHALQTLGVLLMVHEMQVEPGMDRVTLATRKFEALERSIAAKLLYFASLKRTGKRKVDLKTSKTNPKGGLVRGLKIGGAAVAAGTLFAVTGGLAAPAIAAGVAALAGGTAVAATATAILSSTAAITAIFGIGGGGIAAYKMKRRTQGLTEFEFQRERSGQDELNENDGDIDLFSTVAVSGWMRDACDFQRPWGLSPSKPPIMDKVELLERFYCVHEPENVTKAKSILKEWKLREDELWQLLKDKHGRDPDHLFPLNKGPRFEGVLSAEEEEVLIEGLSQLFDMKLPKNMSHKATKAPAPSTWKPSLDKPTSAWENQIETKSSRASDDTLSEELSVSSAEPSEKSKKKKEPPKHLRTVWDYHANYGGELYTVKWESTLLLRLSDSVRDLAFDLIANKGGKELLKLTVLSTLLAAIAVPSALKTLADMIDESWTICAERSDEAGKELARSLLFNRSGNRPVILIGYSFGARAIYSCLRELAWYQEKWEDFQQGTLDGREPDATDADGNAYAKMREPASIVEHAILMGLPSRMDTTAWQACRQVVAGRLVNCFSQKDLILSLMFQLKRPGLQPVCGTCPINIPGIENFDVTDIVLGHSDYCLATGEVLGRVRHCQPFESQAHPMEVPVAASAEEVAEQVEELSIEESKLL